jgi:hypothetical protein
MMKKLLMAALVLAMATMSACDLAMPAETGNSVEVSMDGIDGAGGAKGIGGDATWVSIKVVDASGAQKGSGTLAFSGGKWHGTISVSETGLMTFTATAGSIAGQVAWIGRNDLNVTGNGMSLTVGGAAPTSDGSGYGPARGKVFYDKGDYAGGWRYLEAAPSDQGRPIVWSDITASVLKDAARGYAIGTGRANTTAIVGQAGCTSGAAKACDSLSLGGYDDWFLPSQDELNAMYGDGSKKAAIGGFTSNWYWSSSEVYSNDAYCQNFSNGGQNNYGKRYATFRVRPVRVF